MRHTTILLGTLALALGPLACSDGGTDPGDPLTAQEAEQLGEVLFEQSGDLFSGAAASASSPAASSQAGAGAVPENITHHSEVTDVPCPLGGTLDLVADLEGTVDEEAGTMDLAVSLQTTHHACGVTHEESGRDFVLTGNPSLGVTLDLLVTEETFDMGGSYTGGLRWATDGREGSCEVDLEWSATGDATTETFAGTLDGTVCGVTISRQTELS